MSDSNERTRILLVDDSVTDRTLTSGLIRRSEPDWEIIAVDGARKALDEISSRRPDVVITDLVMPEMDGRELLRNVSHDYPTVPVILVTSKGDDQIAAECVSLGAVNYVPKRRLGEDLVKALREIVNSEKEARATRKVLKYVVQNRCRFEIESQLQQIWSLVNFVRNRLQSMELFEAAEVQGMITAVREALLNAHFHGNFEVNSRPLELPRTEYVSVATDRRSAAPFADRRIRFTMSLEPDRIVFQISDDGTGFDLSAIETLRGSPEERFPNGNGIRQIRMAMDSVSWNERGNEVTLTAHIGDTAG